ncbi:hypothetical protein [Streptomyces sp. HUAS TT7]|uniref:hypothetical protein n=1 Tax=Streptomyces sp. HUAS TT7 TaxID=3447507 RepID=UPI003F65DB28
MRSHQQAQHPHGKEPERAPGVNRAPGTGVGAGLLALQSVAGNAAVVQMLRHRTGHAGAEERHQHSAGCGHTSGEEVQRSAGNEGLGGAVVQRTADKRERSSSPEPEGARKEAKDSEGATAQDRRMRRAAIQKAVDGGRALVSAALPKITDDGFLKSVFGPDAEAGQVKENFQRVLARLDEANTADENDPLAVKDLYVAGEKTSIIAHAVGQTITATTHFHEVDETTRRNTLVHEAVHASLGTPDVAYKASRLIDGLSTKGALQNPDSYVWYALGVVEGQTTAGAGHQIQDRFGEGLTQEQQGAIRQSLGIALQVVSDAHRLLEQAEQGGKEGQDSARYKGITVPTLGYVNAVRRNVGMKEEADAREGIKKLGKIAGFISPVMGSLAGPATIDVTGEGGITWKRDGAGVFTVTVPKNTPVGELNHASLLASCMVSMYPKNHEFLTEVIRKLGLSKGFTDLTNFQ